MAVDHFSSLGNVSSISISVVPTSLGFYNIYNSCFQGHTLPSHYVHSAFPATFLLAPHRLFYTTLHHTTLYSTSSADGARYSYTEILQYFTTFVHPRPCALLLPSTSSLYTLYSYTGTTFADAVRCVAHSLRS